MDRSQQSIKVLDAGKVMSYVAGIVFGIGWWFFIDAAVYSSYHFPTHPLDWTKYVPGILGTMGFFL